MNQLENVKSEEWRTIKGYEGHYMVSNLGRVKSLKKNKEIILKQRLCGAGYYVVNLCIDGKIKTHMVHRLVAISFLNNVMQKSDVNHINENKLDNRVVNLEWLTHEENIRHGTGIERQVLARSKRLIVTDIATGLSKEFISTRACSRELNLDNADLVRVLNNKKKSVKGYTAVYI